MTFLIDQFGGYKRSMLSSNFKTQEKVPIIKAQQVCLTIYMFSKFYKLPLSGRLNFTLISAPQENTHTSISCYLCLNEWRLISLKDREEVDAESNEIQKGTSSACVGTLGLSLITWVQRRVPTPLPSFPQSSGGGMNASEHPNPTPSNTMIAIWGQQQGGLHDSSHNQPSVLKWETTMGFSVSSSKCHSACWCCLCSGQRSPWAVSSL